MILMKNIIREGHKTLTTVAKPVVLPLSDEDIKLGYDLMEYVKNSQDPELSKKYGLRPGVGLAAPQIDVSKRMFAMFVTDLDETVYQYVIINPVITKISNETTYLPDGEGCLSVDRATSGLTPRHYAIEFEGYYLDFNDNTAKPITKQLVGYPAVVFQHENDHLDGIMFTSKLYAKIPNAFPLFEYEEEDEVI